MFGVVLVVPGFDGVGVYSGGFQCKERKLDGDSIRDWLTALSGNVLQKHSTTNHHLFPTNYLYHD
jgi:hypothetical protein